jgi:hypothetical protein
MSRSINFNVNFKVAPGENLVSLREAIDRVLNDHFEGATPVVTFDTKDFSQFVYLNENSASNYSYGVDNQKIKEVFLTNDKAYEGFNRRNKVLAIKAVREYFQVTYAVTVSLSWLNKVYRELVTSQENWKRNHIEWKRHIDPDF